MIRCYWCEKVFEDAEAILIDQSEGNYDAFGVTRHHQREVMACPYCHKTDLEDCCDECSEIVVKVEEVAPERRVASWS